MPILSGCHPETIFGKHAACAPDPAQGIRYTKGQRQACAVWRAKPGLPFYDAAVPQIVASMSMTVLRARPSMSPALSTSDVVRGVESALMEKPLWGA